MKQLFRIFYFAVILETLKWSTVTAEPNWTYDLISVTSNTSDNQLWDWALKAIRIKRGEYAMNGTFNYGLEPNDDIQVEGVRFRSPQGNSYKRLPYGFPKISLDDFMNGIYKNTVMPFWKNCTDFPQFTGSAPISFEKKRYYMKACGLPTENVPPIVMPGYYKVQMHVYGRVTSSIELLLQLQNKIF